MGLIEQPPQHARPVGAQLFVQQGLCARGFLHPDETVVALAVGQAGGVHLAGQPVATVETEIHGEGKPRLYAHMTQAQFLVQEVVVEVKAFAGFEHHVNMLGLAVATHGVGEAVFQRTEDGDQAGGDAVRAGDLPGEGFLADLAAGQIAEGASGLFGTGVGRGFDAGGQTFGKSLEVFDEDAAGVEIGFHDGWLEEMAQRAAQSQSVKAGQNACNRIAKSVKKSRRDAGAGGRSLLVHYPNSYPNARCSATLVAALPRCVSALKLI